MNINEFFGLTDSDEPDDLLKATRTHIKTNKKIPDKILVNMLQHPAIEMGDEAVRYIFSHMENNVTSKLRVPANMNRKNLFEDAVTTFWEYVRIKKPDFDTSRKDAIERFLYIVCDRSIKTIQGGRKFSDELPEQSEAMNITLMSSEQRETILQMFDGLGKGCREILRLFYFERHSYKDIAEITGYGEDSAKVRRNKCIGKLKQQIAQNDNLGRFIRDLLT